MGGVGPASVLASSVSKRNMIGDRAECVASGGGRIGVTSASKPNRSDGIGVWLQPQVGHES